MLLTLMTNIIKYKTEVSNYCGFEYKLCCLFVLNSFNGEVSLE